MSKMNIHLLQLVSSELCCTCFQLKFIYVEVEYIIEGTAAVYLLWRSETQQQGIRVSHSSSLSRFPFCMDIQKLRVKQKIQVQTSKFKLKVYNTKVQ